MRKIALPLLFLALAVSASAQSTTTYDANTGSVTSVNAVTGYLVGGGAFHSPDSMGSGCYYGGCPAWQFSNYPLSYILPDGTTASFTNFTGAANFTNEFDIEVQGTASGRDSAGHSVAVDINWSFAARCRSGRGGGCWKTFTSGTLSVTE